MYNSPNNHDNFLKSFIARSALNKPTASELPTPRKKQPNCLRAFQSDLHELVALCDDLEKDKDDLKNNINDLLPAKREELDNKIMLAEATKKRVFDDTRMKMVEKCLKRVQSRRRRLKRIKEEGKRNKARSIAASLLVDEQIEKKKKELDEKLLMDENNRKTEIVLKDVTRKKIDAKQSIQLLDSICKLRVAREKSALGRGEKISSESAASFSKNIEKLRSFWDRAMADYDKEEIKLRSNLKSASNSFNENVGEASIEQQLKISLFANAQDRLPQKNFANLEQFLFIRSQWDQFVSEEPESSRIPTGWVVPDLPSRKRWRKYLESN